MKKIVVIGGGTGTYTVLTGLKKYPLDLTAIMTVADSGGSTGRLRDEFGYLPLGDFRMALAALADSNGDYNILRQLFLYRFSRGEKGLKGHNFGNLFLVALTDILGGEETAIEFASNVLRIKGKVLSITAKGVELVAKYENGEVVRGEKNIDEPEKAHDGTQKIVDLWVEPVSFISEKAKEAIYSADLIIIGPGDLYTSLLANIVVKGTSKVITGTRAKIVYIANLMTKYGQTFSFTASDHIEELVKYIGREPDYVLLNTTPLPENILRKYGEEQDFQVEDDLSAERFKVIRTDLLAKEEIKKPSGDVLKRSLIRHDPGKLAKEIVRVLEGCQS